jgi:hypothetical protein
MTVSLTEAQSQKVHEYSFYADRRGRTPTQDRDKIERAIHKIYHMARIPVPEKRVWLPSPKAQITSGDLSVRKDLWDATVGSMLNQSITVMESGDWVRLVSSIWERPRRNIGIRVANLLYGDGRSPSPWAREEEPHSITYENSFMGGFDAGMVALLKYFGEVLGFEWCKKVAAFETLLGVGFWWPFRDRVIISELPEIYCDDRGNFHRDNGLAIEWPNSTGFYFSHGVRVPDFIITNPEKISIEGIQHEGNAEVRRVMIQKMGWDRWLRDSGAKPIHSDDFGTLYRIQVEVKVRDEFSWRDPEREESICLVKVTNSTPEPDGSFRDYILRVPPDMRRAKQAIAWTFGLSEDQYRPEMQT